MTSSNHPMPSAELLTDKMETPALDDRSYRVIRLPNKLESLLVHDPETDKASAAMDVNVGNFSDRPDMPGMAHAVEHLLFMGTEKYPRENAYNQYLTSNSGHSNAYTGGTSTNYFFEVAASSNPSSRAPTPGTEIKVNGSSQEPQLSPLYGALDRFAQFFIAPLFLPSTLDRELKAVDSENKKNLQSDMWRLHQVSKALSNPKHPYCHFSTGNLETLKDLPKERGIDVREEFMKFHEREYSANRMKLVVLGRESLDQLEAWVVELFSEVRNKDLPQTRWDDEQPLTDKELLTQYFAKPVMDTRTLEIVFPYMDEDLLYESQPSRYLSHLVGHEGPGSILACIKAKGWANGLGAGSMPICPGAAFFTTQIRLTEEGLKNYKEIIKIIFQYLSLIRETPPREWIFDELKGMAEVDFRFRQKSPASRFTSKLSSVMQKPFPRDLLLSGSSLVRKFDADAIKRALGFLRPDNFRLAIVSQDFPGGWDQKEKWYGTEYRVEKIPADFLQEIKRAGESTSKDRLPELHLPHKNEFIPTKLEVEKKDVAEPLKYPKLIRNDESVRIWWKKDDTFWVPKANVFITLRNSLVDATPENSVKSKLYCELVKDALVEYSYDAEISGLDYSLDTHSAGLDVEVSGYNDKMSVLLEKVLVSMRDLDVRDDRFKIVKERILRGYRNWDYQQPYQQIGEFTRWLTGEKGWITEQLLAELPHVTAEDIRSFFPQLLRQVHIEVLAHGNLYKEDALKIADLVESILRPRVLPQSQWLIRRSLLLPEGANFIHPRTLKDPANVNHCIEHFLFVGDNSDRTLRAKLLLFAQLTDEPCFDQLRTKEQLGYVVFSGPRVTATTMGYRVLVQSDRPAEYLEGRIDEFLRGFSKTLNGMPASEFEEHKRSLMAKRLEKLKNLGQESGRYWAHIGNEYFDFEQVYRDVTVIESLSKPDLIDFFERYIHPSSHSRSKLSIHMIAQSSSTTIPNGTVIPEQKADFILSLNQYLKSIDLDSRHESLQEIFGDVDVVGGDQEAIIRAVRSHLIDDLKLDNEKADTVVREGTVLLGTILQNLGIQAPTPKETSSLNAETLDISSSKEEGRIVKPPVVIDNVHEFKARLKVSSGVRPVKDLCEFEETEAKL
ncbi:MAG: Insulinase (Peptidase M16) [Geoglossum umbratile]|nr:MAG: Insulinase (Peptidase M16) [Geoglossum umbratile]